MDSKYIQLLLILPYIFFDVGNVVVNGMTQSIGYVAHLCGALTGIFIGIGVLRNLEEQKWERVCWWISIAIFVIFMTCGIVIHCICPDYFPNQYV